jgi:SAM-dependent methyltransferase
VSQYFQSLLARRPKRPASGGAPGDEALPLPPVEMRKLVGPTDPADFDNPTGAVVYPYVETAAYESVFDFGCGCGRVARKLIQQRPRPERYVGIDLHRGMVEWCRTNLAPRAPGFEFLHHDVFNYHFNPGRSKPSKLPFPVADGWATLVNAFSVFTHLTESQARHYLREVSRVLAVDGVFHSTWFLFDKELFPALHDDANALYTSYVDPSAAVLFDRGWLRRQAQDVGLALTDAIPPQIRGYQWTVVMRRRSEGVVEIDLPADEAPIGRVAMHEVPKAADRIGLEKS